MKLVKELTWFPYRKESFEILYHAYECDETGERFTEAQTDELNTVQLYNQYREKYGIPFPQQIGQIREQYKASASKMSEILGLGANSYRLYENGDMPTVAIGRLILSIADPEEFQKQVRASAHILQDKERNKFEEICRELIAKKKASLWEKLFEEQIFRNRDANAYSGYRQPDLGRIGQVIAFFDGKIELFKTKLNKVLFYCDFTAYKYHGVSLTGLTYRAISYGPVPAQYEKLYIKLCDDQVIAIHNLLIKSTGDYADLIRPNHKFDEKDFQQWEIDILEKVAATLNSKSTKQIVDLSHKETAWLENEEARENINYQRYAFLLNLI